MMIKTEQNEVQKQAGSFRDPSGFLFWREGTLYRQVNDSYRSDYELLFSSGLYDKLIKTNALVSHDEEDNTLSPDGNAYKILKPRMIPFISYPYEWSFGALQDAALLTLRLQKEALEHGMTLKDASAYNVQFDKGQAIFLDTLSFEKHEEGSPWVAYRQFCQHFLAPLILMAKVDVRLGKMLGLFIDGIPLDLASRLLPWSTWFRFSTLTHIHLHSKSQKKHASNTKGTKQVQKRKMNRLALLGLLDSLESLIKGLKWEGAETEWGDYYDNTNYEKSSAEQKRTIIQGFLEEIKPSNVWDLGANDGTYSRLALENGAHVVSWDIDPIAVEKNYQRARKEKADILPLLLDLTNPSPGLGWNHKERDSFIERGPVDAVMGLALIHHLAISNNVPLDKIASFFAGCGEHLIIEFVPKEDSQVEKLLATREDIFPDYHFDGFKEAFSAYFECMRTEPIENTSRTLCLFKKK